MNFFVTSDQIENNKIYIKGSDVNHIKNVLRHTKGDVLSVVSDQIKYEVQIDEINSECVVCDILNKNFEEDNKIDLTIYQGLAKADKFEYIIQKCTEIGVHRIVPTEMKRCVVKLDNKDKVKKIDRWRKIAEVASKQSLRNDILEVAQVATFMDLINSLKNFDYVIMAYEKEKDVLLKDVLKNINADTCKIAVIIGPEGGIDDSEAEKLVQNGARSVSLGKRILRTETAPIVVAANIMYELES